jgi:hypothetical protein
MKIPMGIMATEKIAMGYFFLWQDFYHSQGKRNS